MTRDLEERLLAGALVAEDAWAASSLNPFSILCLCICI